MYTFQFVDGVLTISNNDVVVQNQPFDPRTQEPWADAATAEAWATEEIKNMNGSLSRKITTLAFVRRFHIEEHAGIKMLIKTDPIAEAIYDRLMMAKFIDLEDPDVEGGLQYYVSKTVITEERLIEILTNPVMEIELP